MRLFAQRFGTLAPDLTLYVVADEEARVAKMREVLGDTPDLQCGLAEGTTIFVQLFCARHALAHEYFHVLQDIWAPRSSLPNSDTGWQWGPWWLFEGTADYAAMEYGKRLNAVTGDPEAYIDGIETRRWQVSYTDAPLNRLEGDVPTFATISYHIAAFAADWLVREAGSDAIGDYFRLLHESSDWRSAFRGAFAMTVDEAYERFEAYRAEAVPLRRSVAGSVTLPNGEPVRHWRIEISPYADPSPLDGFFRDFPADWSAAEADGSLNLRLPDGSYRLLLNARCRDRGQFLGWYGPDGTRAQTREQVQPIVVRGADTPTIDIRLPATPAEIDEICDFGPRHAVTGTVVGPDREPLRQVRVTAVDTRAGDWAYGGDTVLSADDGSFVLLLPDGVYLYRARPLTEAIAASGHGTTVGWLSLPPDYYAQAPEFLTVDGEPVSGIRVQILNRDVVTEHSRHDGSATGSPSE